jgi:hypothetical protein
MEQKKDRPDAEDVAPQPRKGDQDNTSSKPKPNDDAPRGEDHIDGGTAIANDDLNSSNDE